MRNKSKTKKAAEAKAGGLGKYKRVIFYGILLSLVGFFLMYLFTGLNDAYIQHVDSGHIPGAAKLLFGKYVDVIVFFSLYIICSFVFCFTIKAESSDYSMGLIIVYLVIGIFNQINEFNYGYLIWNSIFDILCNILYEVSVVPIIFYVALKMKRHQNKIMILMFSELVVCVLYILGIFASETSSLAVFKEISCSAIFIIVFLALFLIAALEGYSRNEQMKIFFRIELIVLLVSALIIGVCAVLKNEFYAQICQAYEDLVVNYDIGLFRKLILQNILLFSVVIDMVVSYTMQYLHRRELGRTLELEMDLAKEYAESVKARIDDVRTIKHDIKNHINLLNMYYTEGDFDKLGEYLAQIDSGISELRPLTYSKNKLIDYVLMSYSEKFQQEGFKFFASARVSEDLPISESELCSLITNMLSNALESCKNSQNEHEECYVRYIMSMTKSKVQIKCENSCTKSLKLHPTGDVLETEKSNSSGAHGYGMSIIKRICEKNGGAVLFSAEEGAFTLSAVLPIN